MAVIKLKDGRTEIFTDQRIFENLIEEYMGFDALNHFHDILTDYDDKLRDMERGKEQIADYVLKFMLPELDPPDIENWVEDFQVKMEDVYGL